MTNDEIKIIWNNRGLPIKDIMELFPNQNIKTIGNYYYAFRKMKDADLEYIENNRLNMSPSMIDNHLNFTKGATSKFLKMLGLKHLNRESSYSIDEIEQIIAHSHLNSFEEVSRATNIPINRLKNISYKHDIKINRDNNYELELQENILRLIGDNQSIKDVSLKEDISEEAIKTILYNNGCYNGTVEYINDGSSSVYNVSKPEAYIRDTISRKFNIDFPIKNPQNRNYYYGIIPPYEVDIPFNINDHLFAIEYNGEWWHKDKKETDTIKKNMLIEKGYNCFYIHGYMHRYNNLSDLDPVLDMLIQAIENISSKNI